MEDPGYFGVRIAFDNAGARTITVLVNDEGLAVSTGIKICPNAKGVYVAPAHQFPLGVTILPKRRLALLSWACPAGDASLLQPHCELDHAMPIGSHLSVTLKDTEEPASGCAFVISDDGVAITPYNLPKVFEAFFTTRFNVGTGIGLFVAKQFVEGHGGRITITSQDDAESHCTTVRIFVPLHTPYQVRQNL
jgi:hypothetical protein